MTTPSQLDPTAFGGDLERVLVVLHNAKQAGIERMSALQIAGTLTTTHGVRLHWRTVNTLLLDRPDLVARNKQGGRWFFSILKTGFEKIIKPPTFICFVDPSKAVQAVVSLHDLLSHCRGVVRVCDAYLDDVTLQHLDACTQSSEMRVLTRNVKDSGALRALHAAFRTQGRTLHVRVVVANVLHDRYIIDDRKMLILGTSLNTFGKKQCFVIEAGSDMRASLIAVFDGHWATATPWP